MRSKKYKISAMVFMRSTSSRLPQKHLLPIGPYTVAEVLYYNLKRCNCDKLYANIPKGDIYKDEDDITHYYDIIECDNENDITDRIRQAHKKIKADYYLIVSGDCPLISPSIVNDMIDLIVSNTEYDYVTLDSKHIHVGVDVLNSNAIDRLTDGYEDMAFRYQYQLKGLTLQTLFNDRVPCSTIDLYDDLYIFNKYYEILNDIPTYESVCNIKEPLASRVITRKSDMNILIRTSGDYDRVGMGHISRAISTALGFMLHGYSVRVAIPDSDDVKTFIKNRFPLFYNTNLYGYHFDNDDIRYDYDMILNDHERRCWIDYDDYAYNPTTNVDPYIEDVDYDSNYFTSELKTFGMTDMSDIDQKYFTKYLRNTDKVVTVWSQTAREALYLYKYIECYARNEQDENICMTIEQHNNTFKYMGRLEE